MTLGILTAMAVEYQELARQMNDAHEEAGAAAPFLVGHIGPHRVVLQQSGIGKVNAALAAADMVLRHHPAALVSTGVAGGIDATAGVMDVVVGLHTRYHDVWCGPGCDEGQVQGLPTVFDGDPRLIDAALHATGHAHILGGTIATGDRFITDRHELDSIKRRLPEALAVDMESAAIAQVCHRLGVPFLSARIISDTPGAEGHLQQYADFWGEMAHRSFDFTREFIQRIPNL